MPLETEFFGTDEDNKRNKNTKLEFTVRDYDEAFVMFTMKDGLKECLPLRFVRKGYRVLVARNHLFRDSGVRILVHISIR